jgi:hypothetical protein
MGASQIEAERVAEQKLKYWVKVLSEDAIDAKPPGVCSTPSIGKLLERLDP